MFGPQTVFILGAGASCEIGLPTGDALKSDIINILQRDGNNPRFSHGLFDLAMQQICQMGGSDWVSTFNVYAAACARLTAALPMAMSIDNLLHTHQADGIMVRIGKIAIACAILDRERGSYLAAGTDQYRGSVQSAVLDSADMMKSWYMPLMRLLVSGRTVDDLADIFSNVAFIVFNYDRCLEHFLINAVMSYFHVSDEVAIQVVNRLTIVHPYGQVGHLRWQKNASTISSFGDSEGRIIEIADQILTFTESAHEGVIQQVSLLVSQAQTLVFMGFGYLPQNMEMLSVRGKASVNTVLATTLNIGDHDVSLVGDRMSAILNAEEVGLNVMLGGYEENQFHFHPERGTCRNLMDNNWLLLTTA